MTLKYPKPKPYEKGRAAPIIKNDKIWDGPIGWILISSGPWIWWAVPDVTRYMWHSSRHYDNFKTWEDLHAEEREGEVYVLFKNHNPHYTKLPLIDAKGTVRTVTDEFR